MRDLGRVGTGRVLLLLLGGCCGREGTVLLLVSGLRSLVRLLTTQAALVERSGTCTVGARGHRIFGGCSGKAVLCRCVAT